MFDGFMVFFIWVSLVLQVSCNFLFLNILHFSAGACAACHNAMHQYVLKLLIINLLLF